MARALRHVGRQILNAASLARQPLYSPPGHFYSPVSSRADAARALVQRRDLAALDGVELRAEAQLQLAESLGPYWGQFRHSCRRYKPDNDMYGLADGAVYHSMLATLRPQRIIEVGSGFSSAIALDARERHRPGMRLTFIEPYPERLLGLLEDGDQEATTLHRIAVQDVSLDVYEDLDVGDILFIDSTHVSKPGSDVNWLFFVVLPRLRPGVLVHVHDIFFPFEYPQDWLSERRSWNESYLLRAFLSYNHSFEIVFFTSWLWQVHPEVVGRHLPAAVGHAPGSIWLRKTHR